MSDAALFAVVSGPPGSGKSTIAYPLARALGLPLVAKDTIKEALLTVMDARDVETSRAIGAAAVAAMFAVAAETPRGAVIDCNLHRSLAVPHLRRLPGQIIEIFCRCDREVALARYRARRPRPFRLRPDPGRSLARRRHRAGGGGLAGDRGRHQPPGGPRRLDQARPRRFGGLSGCSAERYRNLAEGPRKSLWGCVSRTSLRTDVRCTARGGGRGPEARSR